MVLAVTVPPLSAVGHLGVGFGLGFGLGLGLATAPKTVKYFVISFTFPAASVDTIRSEWSPLWFTKSTGLKLMSFE
jgi:hypothetical protein